jgi:hypothetical protein
VRNGALDKWPPGSENYRMANYAIIHARRIKNGGHARILERHCRREVPGVERWQTAPERAHNNVIYGSMKKRQEIFDDITKKQKWVRKPKRDSAYCIEFVVTASKEIKNMDDYFNDSLQFLLKKGQVFFFAGHYDEKTPHVHFYLLPITKEGEKYRYSSDAVLGNRKDMERLQDEFYEKVGKKYGLERGVKTQRGNEKIKHSGLSNYASKQSRERKEEENKRDKYRGWGM